MKKMPVIFSGHGSPMIALAHNDLTAAFNHIGQEVISRFGKPKAILSICAHWYADGTYIQSAEKPRQIYDMYGFPNELYEVQYPVSGNRDLTMDVLNLLGDKVSINDTWGIDPGTWTVLVHMFPKADIPVVQLSVNRRLTEEECYNLGKELAPLREKGYLIFASGNVVHNLRAIEFDNPIGTPAADAFDEFIKEAVLARNDEAVIHYDTHKDADYAVPTKDHFLPLLYTLGASEGEKPMVYNNIRNLGSMSMTGYIFGMEE